MASFRRCKAQRLSRACDLPGRLGNSLGLRNVYDFQMFFLVLTTMEIFQKPVVRLESGRENDKMVGKRHASEEIATKLAHADELVAKGRTQSEIARAIGVSIMTYHRWRKSKPMARSGEDIASARLYLSGSAGIDDKIKQLELENSRLRRIVTDLLLEKP